MTGPPEEVAGWVDRADLDLRSAAILLERGGPAVVACFLCQQACEKLLKALLVHADQVPTRTHDLAALHRSVPASGIDIALDPDQLDEWTAYAVESRYPGFGDPRAEDDLPALFAFATALRQSVGQIVAK